MPLRSHCQHRFGTIVLRPLKHGTVEPLQTRIVNLPTTFENRFGNRTTVPLPPSLNTRRPKKPSLDRVYSELVTDIGLLRA